MTVEIIEVVVPATPQIIEVIVPDIVSAVEVVRGAGRGEWLRDRRKRKEARSANFT